MKRKKTSKRKRKNPMPSMGWFLVGAAVVGVLGYAGYAYARKKKLDEEAKRKSLAVGSQQKAVDEAIAELGSRASANKIAQRAYEKMYSETCPEVLDPKNPQHQDCIKKWLDLRDLALDTIGERKKAQKKKAASDKGESTDAAEIEGAAADLKAILNTLNVSQKNLLKEALGNDYDALISAADSNDDAAAVAVARRIRSRALSLKNSDPLKAFSLFAKLKTTLGSKWDAIERWGREYA